MSLLDFEAIDAQIEEFNRKEAEARKTYVYERKDFYPIYGGTPAIGLDSEVWFPILEDLTFGMKSINLSHDDLKKLIGVIEGTQDQEFIDSLESQIDELIELVGGEAFIKLNTRSPKDTFSEGIPRIKSGEEAIGLLLTSMRTVDDMILALSAVNQGPPISICVRPFIDELGTGSADEYRTFYKDGGIVGCSAYFYMNAEAKSVESMKATPQLIAIDKMATEIANRFHEQGIDDPFVFDTFYQDGKLTLIEINPYGMSDPCFLSYQEMEESDNPVIYTL